MTRTLKGAIVFCCILLSSLSFSQEKYEVERRVKSSEIPENAKAYLNKLGLQSKIRWYEELSDKGKSFEAKTNKQPKYSIEFSEDGEFQDIELRMRASEIPKDIYRSLESLILERFTRFRYKEIQLQWTGSLDEMVALVKAKGDFNDSYQNIEIEIKAKNSEGWGFYELLIDREFHIISKKRIVLRPLDNIEI